MPKDPRFEAHLAADLDAGQAMPLADGAFRIAILGNFSGGAQRSDVPVSRRRVWRVDRDDLDAAMTGISPELRFMLDASAPPIALRFSAIDDFHPDQLLAHVPLFQQLRELRGQADAAPSRAPAPATPANPSRANAAALNLGSGSLLDRILDDDPATHITGTSAPDELADFVDRAVRPHTLREATREQRELTAKVDDVVTATMRVLLHHPDFQALEALWRATDFLVRRLDTNEDLQVVLVDVSREELAGGEGSTELLRLFQSGSLRGTSLVVGAYSFGPDDVELLSRLATVGQETNTPWIVGGSPRLAGATSFAGDADPDDWNAEVPPEWETLRRSSSAAFLGLALPRFLLRMPYGRRTDECDFPFEEMSEGRPAHESYLWGNAAFLCALAIGDSVAAGEPVATSATIDGFPLHVVTVDGEAVATPCTEALITHRALVHMLDRGLTPIASPRDGDTIRIARLQSVVFPPRALPISAGADR